MTPAGDAPSGGRRSLRRAVYDLLDPTIQTFSDRVVHNALIALVLINVVAVVLESVPSIEERFRAAFLAIEIVSVVAFTAEYALRLWTAVEHMPLAERSPWAARWAWARTPGAVIDLLAVVPFYAALFETADLRALALFRLMRFFKLARYSSGLTSLLEAIYAERHALIATLLILSGLALTMATFMHLAERGAQPERFGTIPDALWWAIVTLTTVGYGDVVPITPLGKIVAGLTAIMGVAMLALPVGIVATSFSEVIHRRAFVVTWSMVAKVPLFSNLGAAEIAEIIQLLHSRSVQKNEVVARRGEKAEAMYFIVNGEVEVELMEADNVRLRAGDFFGEIAILTGDVRNATVRACRDTQLLVLQAHDLERLMDRVPEIGKRIRDVGHARAPDRVEPHPSEQGRRRHKAEEPAQEPPDRAS
ncbi:MAG TPA: cyclic nucleotide-gated ion channel [Beijerinckiaceae bacterium]